MTAATAAATEVVVGLDLGTTTSKALVRDLLGRQLALVSARTPWTLDGGSETTAADLLRLAVDLLVSAVEAAEARAGRVQAVGVGVTGLGESGVLMDASGEPSAPVIAWYDRRGTRQLEQLGVADPLLAEQFGRRTGLRWDPQASLAKLLWLQASGAGFTPAHRWASVPEWVVHRLGGDLVREPSLASRTGMVDQATGDVWCDGVAAAGLPATLLPPAVLAGTAVGRLRSADLPPALRGAALTIAGHDHPVAAVGAGAVGPDALFNSSGTADVVARSVPGVLDDDRRELVVRAGLSAGAHVLPGTTLLLGGAGGGLVLRRVLGALGAAADPERDRVDLAAEALLAGGAASPHLALSGDGRTGEDVVIRIQGDVTPADVWAAAVRHTAAAAGALVATMDGIVGPHRTAVACGGWTRMASVRAAKRAAIAGLQFPPVAEPGLVGAALLAAQAAGAGSVIPAFPVRAQPASGPAADVSRQSLAVPIPGGHP